MRMFCSKCDIKLFINKKEEIFIQVGTGNLFKKTNDSRYKEIKTINNYTIKLKFNCVFGLSIWKGDKKITDGIWSIAEAEKFIQELN